MLEEEKIQTPISNQAIPPTSSITTTRQTASEIEKVKSPKWNKLSIFSFCILIFWFLLIGGYLEASIILKSFNSIISYILNLLPYNETVSILYFVVMLFLLPSIAFILSLTALIQTIKHKEKGRLLSILVILISAPISIILNILLMFAVMFARSGAPGF